jgi:hypothetical protein
MINSILSLAGLCAFILLALFSPELAQGSNGIAQIDSGRYRMSSKTDSKYVARVLMHSGPSARYAGGRTSRLCRVIDVPALTRPSAELVYAAFGGSRFSVPGMRGQIILMPVHEFTCSRKTSFS